MTARALNSTAVITGASSGIGAIYADRLARQGYDLILVARNAAKLDQVANRLRLETKRSIEIVPADLIDRSDIQTVEDLLRNDPRIAMLVNNAGVGATAPLIEASVAKMQDMIDLNVTALMRLTYAAVPAFAARGDGTIINIASVVGIAPELLNGVYGGTKAFVIAFSRSLLHEFAAKGLRVQVVLPGATETDFWDIAGTPIAHLPSGIVMPAEQMVDAALAGLAMGEFVTIPSLPEQADWVAFEEARSRLLPYLSLAKPAMRYATKAS